MGIGNTSSFGLVSIQAGLPLLIGVVACVLFVIRNISIGSLMMPLLTWGTSNVDPKKVADASSLLTSLRTIAGAIGSAVFVGIMSAVSAGSAAAYGDRALMHGMNVSFFWMAAGSLALLLIAGFGAVFLTAFSD